MQLEQDATNLKEIIQHFALQSSTETCRIELDVRNWTECSIRVTQSCETDKQSVQNNLVLTYVPCLFFLQSRISKLRIGGLWTCVIAQVAFPSILMHSQFWSLFWCLHFAKFYFQLFRSQTSICFLYYYNTICSLPLLVLFPFTC